jgi:dipeptidyl aminopeptidase/acylaminoacyl peptidase
LRLLVLWPVRTTGQSARQASLFMSVGFVSPPRGNSMSARFWSAVFFLVAFVTAGSAQQAPEQRTANNGNVVLSGVPEVPPEIPARLQPYQNTRAASFADWTPDGDAIYISTRFANVAQLHRVASPGAARYQLTFGNEPIRGASRRPGNGELLYTADEAGGEFFQFFAFDPATGQARRLTDGPSRNTGATWSDDGVRLAFTSTRRDGRSNDIWVMSVDDTASARVVLESPDGTFWSAADWDPSGERLLVLNYVSIADSRIHLLDLRTGRHQRILGDPRRPAAYYPAGFDREGRGIFLTTDRGGEFTQLAYQPLPRGRLEILTADIPWNVEDLVMSKDRSRAAFTLNEGGISRLYLLDPATRQFRRVETVPEGIISGGGFSPDGRQFAFTLNSAAGPADVYSLALAEDAFGHAELTRWTFSEVGGLNPETFVTPELIDFPSFDAGRIPAFVYRPRGAGPHPVVIHIHGGPEAQSRPGFSSVFQSWINEFGIAVIDPNVRGSAGYGRTYLSLDDGMLREDAVRDIGALLDWIATQPDLDQNRVMVYGGSYGGYMVLASLMHYSDRLRGGVNIVGISDFITFLENTESYRRDLRRVEYGDERDPQMRAFFERISPLRNAERITAPLFVIHGQNDPRVPVSEAEQIVREVRDNGYPVWYMNALNEGHGYARRENQDLMRDLVVLFFQEHLLR